MILCLLWPSRWHTMIRHRLSDGRLVLYCPRCHRLSWLDAEVTAAEIAKRLVQE